MSDYPMMLFRAGSEFSWDGRDTDTHIVTDADEHEAALTEGWKAGADYLASSAEEPDLLDRNAKQIAEAIPELSLDEMETYRAAEVAGKSRKGVLALFDAAIDEKLKG